MERIKPPEVCFFCEYWIPLNPGSREAKNYESGRFAPPNMEGVCQATKDPKTFWLVEGTYAPTSPSVEDKTNAQQPCDVYVKRGSCLGLGIFGGKMVRVFIPRKK